MASILETFYILFDSDAENVKKGAAEAKQTTDKLNQSLNTTDAIGKKLGSSFVGLIKSAAGIAAAFLSVSAISTGIRSAIQYADRLDELSQALEVNIEDLSAWGDAVQLNGGTAEGFQETAKAMTAALADFATKGKSRVAPFFKELGISMVDSRGKARNFIEVLPDIAAKFEKLGKQEAFGLGRKMGLDQGTIMLLQKGRKEVDEVIKRQKELGVVTKQDAEIAAKFNDQWDYTAIAFRSLFTVVNSYVLPPLTAILKGMEKTIAFMRANKDFVIGGLIALGGAILRFVIPPLITMAVSAAVAFAPFFLIAAAITTITGLFALLYDDIMTFKAGGESLTGDIVKKWPVVIDIIRSIGDTFNYIIDTVKLLYSYLIGLFTDPIGTWRRFKADFLADWEQLVGAVPQLGQAFEFLQNIALKVFDKIKERFGAIIDLIKSSYNAITGFFGGGGQATQNIELGKSFINNAATSPIASQTSNSIANNSRVNSRSVNVQTGDISIQTQATNADDIAGAFGKSLRSEIDQTIDNFDDGVVA
jgi:hypothetical protein